MGLEEGDLPHIAQAAMSDWFIQRNPRNVAGKDDVLSISRPSGDIGRPAEDCGAMFRTDGPEHLRSVGETEFLVGMAAMAASATSEFGA